MHILLRRKGVNDMFNADDLKKKFLNDIETARSESQLSEVWKTYLSARMVLFRDL